VTVGIAEEVASKLVDEVIERGGFTVVVDSYIVDE
jgi:hypothetical protein